MWCHAIPGRRRPHAIGAAMSLAVILGFTRIRYPNQEPSTRAVSCTQITLDKSANVALTALTTQSVRDRFWPIAGLGCTNPNRRLHARQNTSEHRPAHRWRFKRNLLIGRTAMPSAVRFTPLDGRLRTVIAALDSPVHAVSSLIKSAGCDTHFCLQP